MNTKTTHYVLGSVLLLGVVGGTNYYAYLTRNAEKDSNNSASAIPVGVQPPLNPLERVNQSATPFPTRLATNDLPKDGDYASYEALRNKYTLELSKLSDREAEKQDELRVKLVAINERIALCPDAGFGERFNAQKAYCLALAREHDVEGVQKFLDEFEAAIVKAGLSERSRTILVHQVRGSLWLARVYVAAERKDTEALRPLLVELEEVMPGICERGDGGDPRDFINAARIPLVSFDEEIFEEAKSHMRQGLWHSRRGNVATINELAAKTLERPRVAKYQDFQLEYNDALLTLPLGLSDAELRYRANQLNILLQKTPNVPDAPELQELRRRIVHTLGEIEIEKVKHVHWNVSAQRNESLTKQTENDALDQLVRLGDNEHLRELEEIASPEVAAKVKKQLISSTNDDSNEREEADAKAEERHASSTNDASAPSFPTRIAQSPAKAARAQTRVIEYDGGMKFEYDETLFTFPADQRLNKCESALRLLEELQSKTPKSNAPEILELKQRIIDAKGTLKRDIVLQAFKESSERPYYKKRYYYLDSYVPELTKENAAERLQELSQSDSPIVASTAKKGYVRTLYAGMPKAADRSTLEKFYQDALERISDEQDDSVVSFETERLLELLSRSQQYSVQDLAEVKRALQERFKSSENKRIRRLQYLPILQ